MLFFFVSLACQSAKDSGRLSDEVEQDSADSADASDLTSGEERDAVVAELDPDALPAGDNPCRDPILIRVNYVVDGDTFYGQGNLGEEKVRVIGINSSELGYEGDPSDCYAQEAQAEARQLLSGRLVWLTFDQQCQDGYDRTLAYVHFGLGEQGFFERVMLQGGYVKAYPFQQTSTFADVFDMDEGQAAQAEIGGWGACGW